MKNYKIDGFIYQILSEEKKEAELIGCYKVNKDNAVAIPDVITIYSVEYKVVKIARKALEKCNSKEKLFLPSTIKELNEDMYGYSKSELKKQHELCHFDESKINRKKQKQKRAFNRRMFGAFSLLMEDNLKDVKPFIKEIYFKGSINEWIKIDNNLNNLFKLYVLNDKQEYVDITAPGEIELERNVTEKEVNNIFYIINGLPHNSDWKFAKDIYFDGTTDDAKKIYGLNFFDGLYCKNNLNQYINHYHDDPIQLKLVDNKLNLEVLNGLRDPKPIILPNEMKIIKTDTFKDQKLISRLIIPSNIEKIETRAFNNCPNLLAVYIPYTVKKVESKAFNDCPKLRVLVDSEKQPRGWHKKWAAGVYVSFHRLKKIDINNKYLDSN